VIADGWAFMPKIISSIETSSEPPGHLVKVFVIELNITSGCFMLNETGDLGGTLTKCGNICIIFFLLFTRSLMYVSSW
jgi:hypothetical protein